LSFFDDGEDTAPRTQVRRGRSAGPAEPAGPRTQSGAARSPRPRPRSPQGAGGGDQHTMMMRRRLVALGVGVVLLIIIVLGINSCLKSQKTQSLKDYNRKVSQLAQESDEQVAKPLFQALAGAGGRSALQVEEQINQLQLQAENIAARAKKQDVPGDMTSAQRALLLALDMRVEGMAKIAALVPAALGGQAGSAKTAATKIAGDMEIFLASDVIYSQRVAPLIQQTLTANGITELTTAQTRFLPNVGWLDPTTAEGRITGKATGSTTTATTGTHGSALIGVAVGTNTLQPEETGAVNHVTGGSSPTFTVTVENTGESVETGVKVEVDVTAGGKQYKASHAIDSTQPGAKVNVEIRVVGVPLGVAAKIETKVATVPGETNADNNKNTYLAVFSQ
jgi:hypothetical protein